MIGLSTTIFKSAGKKLVNLFGSLASRSTYVENVPDSLSEKNHIDDLGVLDKATILLTPTATSDARVHSVKTYTGDELVTNGGFDTDSGWSKVNSTISGGKGNLDGDGQTALLWQDILTDGKTYKATFTISNYDGSGTARLMNNSASITYYTITGNGTFTTYFRHSDASGNLIFQAKSGAVFSIDNISVTEADADFDFDRASSATRINSSGLVQDMQSITDPELVLNGDFSEIDTTNAVSNPTFDLGSDLVTNGDFTTSGIPDTSSYTLGWYSNTDGVEIANGKLTLANDASGGANAYATDGVSSANILTTNKIYKLTFDITDNTNCSAFQIYQNAGSFVSVTNTVGSYTYYITNTSNSLFLFRNNTVNSSISLDNVSIKEITDWDEVPAGWSFDGNGATHASGNTGILKQYNVTVADNKTWKVQLKVNNVTSGTVIFESGDQESIGYGEGTHEFYHKNTTGNTLGLKPSSDFAGTIEYVNVFEVDPNDRWSLGTGWSIEDGVAVASNSSANATQETFTIDAAKTYKIDFTISDYGGGTFFITFGGNDNSSNFTANGSYTVYISPTNRVNNIFYLRASGFTGKIDNVSVKDITFSEEVDLARINYDSNGENGHILLEPTSTNFVPYSEDFSQSDWVKQTNITPTYNTTETLSPDGTYNATKLVGNGTDGIYDSSLSITGDVTRSVYLKSVSGTINVKLKDSNVDIGTETLTVTTEWQRFYLSGDNGTSSQGIWIDDIPLSGVYIFGAQVENLPYATSYIPNHGTALGVTRATETLLGSGNSTLINSTEGVLYAEIAALADDISGFRVLGISDGGSTNRIFIGYSSNNIYANVGAGTTIGSAYTPTNASNFHKVALKYENNNCKFFVNGSQIGSTTTSITIPSGMNSLQFDSGAGGSDFYGKCKALTVFNEALSDDELELLTGVTNYSSFGALAAAGGYTTI